MLRRPRVAPSGRRRRLVPSSTSSRLTGISDQNDRVQGRVRGAVAALEARHVRLPPEWLVEEDLTIEGGRRGLGRLIDAGRRPSALICSSDVLAYGVLIESRARDIAVPRDLSVVGFDDLEASAHLLPALTSLAIPAEEMVGAPATA